MSLKCLIVDDEPLAQSIIERYIDPIDNLKLVSKCKSTVEALNILRREKIDLIFLDIEMPQLDGLSFVKSLENRPKVIITTAYREYAIEGFELEVVDYLLKPIPYDRLIKAVNRVFKLHSLEMIAEENDNRTSNEYIYLKADKKMVQLYFDDILYIEGLSNYVRIFTRDKPIISYQKLSHLEGVLPSSMFSRAHRSYIVSLTKVKAYSNTQLELESGAQIPLGGNYKKEILNHLSQYER